MTTPAVTVAMEPTYYVAREDGMVVAESPTLLALLRSFPPQADFWAIVVPFPYPDSRAFMRGVCLAFAGRWVPVLKGVPGLQ